MKIIFTILAAFLPFMFAVAQNTQEEDLDLTYAAELLKPGTPAPDFTLNDINGKPVTLSNFHGRKVVLVFLASWCPDCRAEVPDLKALHASANPEEVAFVSVSFDRSLEALQTFASENYLPGVQLFDPAGKKESTVASQYGVKWIPSLYVIDEKGIIQLGTVMIGKVAKALNGTPSFKQSRQLCSDESCSS